MAAEQRHRRGWHWWIRRIWITSGLAFLSWMAWNAQAHGVAPELLESTPELAVTVADDMTLFLPARARSTRPALVFLPGGAVDPNAYVPLLRRIADTGAPVALVKLPWRMAFTEGAQAETWARVLRARAALGDSRLLVLAGHSRGAALAGKFASTQARNLAGLIMIATTHPRDENLSALTIPVLKIAGTRDCVADLADSKANSRNLPRTTTWVVIQGANHAQFGYYGTQLGDCQADITREAQQQGTFDAVLGWLAAMPD